MSTPTSILAAVVALVGCTSRSSGGTPHEVASASASATSSTEPDASVPSEPGWQLRCLVKHYPAARIEGTGLRIGTQTLPLDDGVAREGEDRFDHPDVRDVFEPPYPVAAPLAAPLGDPGRARLEPLLAATYGATPAEVQAGLVAVSLAGASVRVHRNVAVALGKVARSLEGLFERDASLRGYFTEMGGTYNDRTIAGTDRKSAHAYGIAIDIGTARADYWRNAPRASAATWKNRIPAAIVSAFEAEGFVWGGRWTHYDTMHFEYRPELFDASCRVDASSVANPANPPESTARAAPVPSVSDYGWTGQPGALASVDTLRERFAPPPGFHLQSVEKGTFPAFLLGLPLAAKGTPVTSFRGDVLVLANDPRIAAVTTLDVGTRDLQQCADAVLRMHAEYKFLVKDDSALSYRAASKFPMPFARWEKGERIVPRGNDLEWTAGGATTGRSHANFRAWLDTVFNYANTVSIARDATTPARADVHAGDFFVQGGWPGHAVLILAIAENDAGEKRALLGQSYMPAQSFQVLASAGEPWFSLQADTVETPFWRPFGWGDLRRMP